MIDKVLYLIVKTILFFKDESDRYDEIRKPIVESCDCGKYYDMEKLVCFIHEKFDYSSADDEFHHYVI